jgi:hypothetical protein
MINTLVKLGKHCKNNEVILNSSICLAYITEILPCNPFLSSKEVIEFMMDSI